MELKVQFFFYEIVVCNYQIQYKGGRLLHQVATVLVARGRIVAAGEIVWACPPMTAKSASSRGGIRALT